MKTKDNQIIRESHEYVSPEVMLTEIQSEGVLCQSGETEDYNYWEFEW